MNLEGLDCWDDYPIEHGCICGNDCQPPGCTCTESSIYLGGGVFEYSLDPEPNCPVHGGMIQ